MKPSIPDVIDRFRAYQMSPPVVNVLHVFLDGNTRDCFFTEEDATDAKARNDHEGAELIGILRSMSRTQRGKLSAQI